MSPDDLPLPDNVDALKSMRRAEALEREVEALRLRHADAEERIKVLLQTLKSFDRARFGRRSKKLGVEGRIADANAQQTFVFVEIETDIAA